jgi:2-haloalkanoic acid dehalogenase type II
LVVKPVKLVMVDCYGTMLHPPDIDAAITESLRQYYDVEVIKEAFHNLRAELTPELKRSFISQRCRFDVIIGQLLRKLRLSASLQAVVSANVMDSFAEAPAYTDSAASLLKLASCVTLAVVTNGDEQPVRSALRQLPAVFRDITTSEAARCYKPDSRIFEYALSRSGIDPSSVMVIGDDPDRDCAPARKLGMYAIQIDRNLRLETTSQASFPNLSSTLPHIAKLL